MGVKFGGVYQAELIGPDGKVKQAAEMRNVITDAGLNWALTQTYAIAGWTYSLSAYYGALKYIGVGTGTNTPQTTDTALQSQAARKLYDYTRSTINTPNVSTPGAPYAYSATVFGPSEANGNLTEVGMFTEQSGGVMWSRALFTTPGGSPVVINKQQGDILTVRYTLTVSRTSEDPVVQSITDSRGTTYQVKWILTNNALRGLLDGERWTSNYCRSYTAGNNNSTDPSATQTAINGSAVGTFPSTATRTYETAHQGPSGGFYRVTTLKLDTTYCNGNVKELFIYGIDAYKSSIQSGLCVAMTFNNSGNGLQKTIDDEITLPIRMVFSR